MRIEIREKYELNGKGEDYWRNILPPGAEIPDSEFGCRRTYILVEEIERPIDIPDNKNEFILRLWSGQELLVEGDYDTFCILLDDAEEKMLVEYLTAGE